MRRHPLLLLVTSATLVLAVVGLTPSYAGGTAGRAEVQQTKRIVVQWQGYQKRPTYVKTANVPGIGRVDLVCRPNSTMIRLHANDRRDENQMWLAKFETKNGTDRVAVKNVRVYTYATAADDGTGGTGPQAHEGLNQRSPVEDFQKGTAYGVISAREGRNKPGGGAMTVPATAFKLTWYWERFAYPGSQYCKMTLALRTDTTQQFGLSWHGNAEAATQDRATFDLPGTGGAQVQLHCETGKRGDQSVALATDDPAAYMDYEYIRSEGPANDPEHLEYVPDLERDPVTGLVGPVDLPTNGMMRIWWSVNGVKRAWVLSSYMVVNNDAKPGLNLCEVAAARQP